MPAPKLTIGMAHHSDYDGVYFSIQALRAYHSPAEVELIVVDNSPDNEHGKAVASLVKHWAGGRYIPMPEATGTTQPRERIFAEAAAPYVVCMDCHVLLVKGAVQALLDHYAADPDSRDLISGPMFYDDGRNLTTHFNEVWRSEMWGTWGVAWSCQCGQRRFSPVDVAGRAAYWSLTSPQAFIRQAADAADSCDCYLRFPLPNCQFAGHEAHLIKAGYRPIIQPGQDPFTVAAAAPFEIPGCGLGCFSMRKAAWPGFNPHFREFGGEELYIHTKTRQRGGRALCVPAFGWVHRFDRPGGVKYPLTRYAKVRNYVLGYQEVGLDIAPIHAHFVATGLMSEKDWQYLLADPIAHTAPGQRTPFNRDPTGSASKSPPQPPASPAAAARPQPPDGATVPEIHAFLREIPRDLDQHLDQLRDLATGATHVVEITKRRESTAALLAAAPKTLVSYQREEDPLLARLPCDRRPPDPHGLPADLPATEVLYIDDVHTADRLGAQLDKYAPLVSRRIILRGTAAFGERAEGVDAPGLLPALRRFLRQHPEWTVIYHAGHQYGLTAISRDPADKPTLPGVIKLAANFAQAVAAHVADGAGKVTPEALETRLETCSLCDQRRDDRCSVCGCYIAVKAAWRTSECPLGRWSAVTAPPAAPPSTA